jgi:hypothetical protein
MENEEKKISKFSSGINILQRVDQLWKNCQTFKRNGHYYKWNEELDSVWLELARDLKPEQYYDIDDYKKIITDSEKRDKKVKEEGYKTKFDKFDARLKALMPFSDSGGIGFQLLSDKDNKNRSEQYKVLMEKQLFLARLENELGKGTSWDEEDDDF